MASGGADLCRQYFEINNVGTVYLQSCGMADRVIHRHTETAGTRDFLTSATDRPTALVIEGEPGIGKTTVWLSAIDEARSRGFACCLHDRVRPRLS